MTRTLALADRAVLFCMKLLAGLNLLFFITFLIVLAMATGRAHADATACSGADLMEKLRKDDPDAYSDVRKQADAVLNGRGVLWKLEKQGTAPSYLFGTFHLSDPRVVTLPPAAQIAYDAAATVVIETTDVLDQSRMMAAMSAEPELMMFTGSQTLTSQLSAEDAEALNKGLKARGIPLASVAKMKPWMLLGVVAVPQCELARRSAGEAILDVKLAQDADAAGKALGGLETAADQLRAMASLPMEFHIQGLVETLQLGDGINDLTETMIRLYQQGEVGMIMPMFTAVMPQQGSDMAGYAAFEEALINKRNKGMIASADAFLSQGNAFIAVGALHLPGPEGLVEGFRKAGYTVSAVQ
ncbi:TraB/GumN family protein [Aquamicrobium sp.]|uniref:TraB/GumN family protein n=1 Tax=Aquamicrobium sp. TaxID=1872579 RepID=UPI0025841447|nr:TraB/GumN family protein [Aquamicrobium sp.]MCK9552630.1 TraB/GumN family protein [Aquamicrobium sp.]